MFGEHTWSSHATQVQFKQCGILPSAFYQFFKTTLDIRICALNSPLLVPSVCFFKPDYAKGS